MYILYEKIEKYLDKLRMLPKSNKIFTALVKNISETGFVTPSIIIQTIVNDDVYVIRYSEELPIFQLVSTSIFNVIPETTLREAATKSYNDSYITFEKKLDDEYQKIITILKTMGYIDIENAIIQ